MYHDRAQRSSDDPKAVTLTGRDLADAERLLSLLAGRGRENSEAPQTQLPAADQPVSRTRDTDRPRMLMRAKEVFAARRRRDQIFGRAMFGEPAWDMLLALYITEEHGSRQTVSRLTQFAGAPPTTALRWLNYLERQKLITRESHPTDRRAVFVEISDKGREALNSYFSETLATEA